MSEPREALSAEAARWLAEQVRWEDRLGELRRPGGFRPRKARRPRPVASVRQAS
ncbi:MAG: hypothetical protein H0V95_08260 [Actinobacteria bacterium]|nr:hypothetical protein [Actinomycetota bacterium]